jgi:hypothetical protein
MPCDNWVHYTTQDDGKTFVGEKMHEYFREELEWIAYRQELYADDCCSNHKIIHRWNGGQIEFGMIPVDGYCSTCHTVYMYDGARFHGRCPECPRLVNHPSPEYYTEI